MMGEKVPPGTEGHNFPSRGQGYIPLWYDNIRTTSSSRQGYHRAPPYKSKNGQYTRFNAFFSGDRDGGYVEEHHPSPQFDVPVPEPLFPWGVANALDRERGEYVCVRVFYQIAHDRPIRPCYHNHSMCAGRDGPP